MIPSGPAAKKNMQRMIQTKERLKMTKSNYKLTKEDFKQINRRSLFTFQLGWNYERMQGSGLLVYDFATIA